MRCNHAGLIKPRADLKYFNFTELYKKKNIAIESSTPLKAKDGSVLHITDFQTIPV